MPIIFDNVGLQLGMQLGMQLVCNWYATGIPLQGQARARRRQERLESQT